MVPLTLCMKSYFYFSSFSKLMEICVVGANSSVQLYAVQLENRHFDIAPCVERMTRSVNVKNPLLDVMYWPFKRTNFCVYIVHCAKQCNYLILFLNCCNYKNAYKIALGR